MDFFSGCMIHFKEFQCWKTSLLDLRVTDIDMNIYCTWVVLYTCKCVWPLMKSADWVFFKEADSSCYKCKQTTKQTLNRELNFHCHYECWEDNFWWRKFCKFYYLCMYGDWTKGWIRNVSDVVKRVGVVLVQYWIPLSDVLKHYMKRYKCSGMIIDRIIVKIWTEDSVDIIKALGGLDFK